MIVWRLHNYDGWVAGVFSLVIKLLIDTHKDVHGKEKRADLTKLVATDSSDWFSACALAMR